MEKITAVTDLGIASNSAEARSGAIVKGSNGKFYAVLPSIGFLVCVDLATGASTQHNFEKNASGAPYKSFASQAGKCYTGANSFLYEFDPVIPAFTKVIDMKEQGATLTGWGFCEDANGIIYFSNYPNLYLYALDPASGTIRQLGLIDDTQMYCFSQAADANGWVYSSVGTAEVNVIGIHTLTGERKAMFPWLSGTGSSAVYATRDGRVAAKVSVTDANESHLDRWHILENGTAKEIVEQIDHYYATDYPWSLHIPYEGAPVIKNMDYPSHAFDLYDPSLGIKKTITFEYLCKGANCSPMTLGPDGMIYGTTNHPMNLFVVDPKTDTVKDYGIKSIGRSVGNICCYASQGSILVGAAYSGGYIYRIDTRLGIVNDAPGTSPKQEAVVEAIHRPRVGLALSDGFTCLFSGYGGYGVVGAGMAVYDVRTGKTDVLENKDLLPHHGILAMAELPDGNVLCGSTVIPHGGALPVHDTAALFEFHPATRTIGRVMYPFEGEKEIAHMVGVGDIVYGITASDMLFTYDPASKSVCSKESLKEYGGVVRQGMVPYNGVIVLLMSLAVLTIDPKNARVHCAGMLPEPATSGIAVTDKGVYYCSGSRVQKAVWA